MIPSLIPESMKSESIKRARRLETPGWVLFLFSVSRLFFPGVLPCTAEPGFGAPDAWRTAVSHRVKEETAAPQVLRYIQYQLDKAGIEKSRETGIWSFSYSADGKATIEVRTATKDGKDFTEERRRRLDRGRANATKMLDILSPFDERAQSALRLGAGIRIERDGHPVWEYPFELPRDDRTLVGTAWVDAQRGIPLGFRYSLRPLPMFVDRIDVRVTFNQDQAPGRFQEIEYFFAASFLIFSWIGGGVAWPEEWVRLPVRPRFGE